MTFSRRMHHLTVIYVWQQIEFTIEDGALFVLDARTAQRSPQAAVRVAVSMVVEGLASEREALLRIDPRLVEAARQPVVQLPSGEWTRVRCDW